MSNCRLVRTILKIASPLVLSLFVQNLNQVMNIVFMGRLNNPVLLAGVGLGTMTSNILCLSILLGFNAALQTLASRAYSAGDLHLCGVYLNRARIIMAVAFLPTVLVLAFSEKILVAIGQDPEVSKYAYQYMMVLIPAMFLYI